jgi:hypothetical protein
MHPRVKIKTRTTPQKRLGNLWKRFFPCFHRLSYINFWKTDIAVENCSFILRLWVCNFPIKFCDFSTVILCYTPLLEGMIYIYIIYIYISGDSIPSAAVPLWPPEVSELPIWRSAGERSWSTGRWASSRCKGQEWSDTTASAGWVNQ